MKSGKAQKLTMPMQWSEGFTETSSRGRTQQASLKRPVVNRHLQCYQYREWQYLTSKNVLAKNLQDGSVVCARSAKNCRCLRCALGASPSVLLSTMDSQLEAVRHKICKVEDE